MTISTDESKLKQLLNDPYWRINNLYYIIDKHGRKIKFKLNWAQKDLYDNLWYCNVILKARQLGLSTFISILFLDRCFFNDNVAAGIIAHTRDDAEKLFRRVKFAYDNLPDELKAFRPAIGDSAKELAFNNGSTLRVGTSMRSATLQYLHISEFGYVCANFPDKAKEIVTGSLNTIAQGQYIFIESTADGSAGAFYDMCQKSISLSKSNLKLTPLDFRFHFYPWWKEPTYVLDSYIEPKKQLKEYFQKLDNQGIRLGGNQIAWYCKKYDVLEDSILQEFPSTPEEAFQGSASGLFYGKCLTESRLGKRIGNVPYTPTSLVHTAWDIGRGDYTAIWFFQLVGNEIRIIDFYQDNGKPFADYVRHIKSKGYTYGQHILPMDAGYMEYAHDVSVVSVARELGLKVTLLYGEKEKRLTVMEGIDSVKVIFPRCWFDLSKCEEGIRMLENYRKEWDERMVKWSEKPVHDFASHAADAFRYLAIGLARITEDSGNLETDSKALRRYFSG